MNLEESSVIASDALIDNFPCSKSLLILGSADWSGIGLGILSVAGPVQAISSGPSVTQQRLHEEPSFSLHDPFKNLE